MIEAGRDRTRTEKHDTIPKGYDEKEGSCLFMAYLQILLKSGQHGCQNNPRNEVQEEDSHKKEKGR
jgi:hypothetical protein